MIQPVHPPMVVEHISCPSTSSDKLKAAVRVWNEVAPKAMEERLELHSVAERAVNAELEVCGAELDEMWQEIRQKDSDLCQRERWRDEALQQIRQWLASEAHSTGPEM